MITWPWPWQWPGTGPAMTQSEYDRRLAEASGMAEICVRVIPDPEPEAGS
jgi:hypothetical protein